jgi:hypothetical protein
VGYVWRRENGELLMLDPADVMEVHFDRPADPKGPLVDEMSEFRFTASGDSEYVVAINWSQHSYTYWAAEDPSVSRVGPVNDPSQRDQRPHSRACGWRWHPHNEECAADCPTCHT